MLAKLQVKLMGLLPQILLALSLLAAVMWFMHSQYKRGEDAANKRFEVLQANIRNDQLALEKKILGDLTKISDNLKEKNHQTDVKAADAKITMIREIHTQERLSDPEQGLTPEMLKIINDARKETQ